MPAGLNFYAAHTWGNGSVQEVGGLMKAFGATRVMIVCDPVIWEIGVVKPVVDSLEAAGLTVLPWPHVVPDPHDEDVDVGVTFALENNYDGMVGVGGGSSIDTAKCINFVAANGGKASDYMSYKHGMIASKVPLKPQIWIPTTSGTGSEVTFMSVIDDGVHKDSISAADVLPQMAIIDPEMMVGMPPRLTANTGMDALAHAAESMTGIMCTPFTEAWSREAIRLIKKSLFKAVKDGKDLQARADMAYGAAIAGYAFTNALPHVGHAAAHGTGSLLHIPHGEAAAQLLPYALRIAAGGVPDKVKGVGEILGVEFTGDETPEEIGQKVFDCVYAMNKELGIRKFKSFVEDPSCLEAVIDECFAQNCNTFSTVPVTREMVSDMIYAMYNEED